MDHADIPNIQSSTAPGLEHSSIPAPEGPPTPWLSATASRRDHKGLGWLVLLPIACCGGPLLIVAVAAAGAAAWGGRGAGVAIALAVALVVVVRRRRAAACCAPTGQTLGGGLARGQGGGPYA
jgi:Flp pilus assembly protein TadB